MNICKLLKVAVCLLFVSGCEKKRSEADALTDVEVFAGKDGWVIVGDQKVALKDIESAMRELRPYKDVRVTILREYSLDEFTELYCWISSSSTRGVMKINVGVGFVSLRMMDFVDYDYYKLLQDRLVPVVISKDELSLDGRDWCATEDDVAIGLRRICATGKSPVVCLWVDVDVPFCRVLDFLAFLCKEGCEEVGIMFDQYGPTHVGKFKPRPYILDFLPGGRSPEVWDQRFGGLLYNVKYEPDLTIAEFARRHNEQILRGHFFCRLRGIHDDKLVMSYGPPDAVGKLIDAKRDLDVFEVYAESVELRGSEHGSKTLVSKKPYVLFLCDESVPVSRLISVIQSIRGLDDKVIFYISDNRNDIQSLELN